jgi:peptide deformylase
LEKIDGATSEETTAIAVSAAKPSTGRVLPVLKFERRLRYKPCAPISIFGKNEWVAQLARDLDATCKDLNGYGIAAPQIGIFFQVCLVNTKDEQFILVNPRVTETSGTQENLEGCLSLPGCAGRAKRPKYVTLRTRLFKDGNIGDEVEIQAEGMEAAVFQHELDHLKGEFFVDRMSSLRRDIMLRKVAKSWGGNRGRRQR